jgi:hypothetical protein
MNSINQAIRAFWEAQGIANPLPATPGDIATFEARHSVRLPEPVVEYFLLVNGTRVGQWGIEDDLMISFWHLDQVQTLSEWRPHDQGMDRRDLFIFADFNIDGVAWAVQFSSDGAAPVPVVSTDDLSRPVAASFQDFLGGYMARSMMMLFPDPGRSKSGRVELPDAPGRAIVEDDTAPRSIRGRRRPV